MKYELREGEIVRVKDGKVVATVNDGKVIPTAPVYYKIIDELEDVASGQSLDSDQKNETKEISASDITYVESEEVNEMPNPSEEPEQSKQFGDKTPGYPTWLHKTDPEKAAEQYKGRNVPEYEALIK